MKAFLIILSFILCNTAKSQSESMQYSMDSILLLSETFNTYNLGDTIYFNYKNGFVSNSQESKFKNKQCISFGVITEKNQDRYLIKVRLIESCDRRGIIAYDSKNLFTKNRSTGQIGKLNRPINIYMYVGKELWFTVNDWSK